MAFLNRADELNFLEKRYRSTSAEMLLIYGRRRVGKTMLVRKFMEGKRGAYLLVKYTSPRLILDDFAASLRNRLSLPYEPSLSSFSDLYEVIGELSRRRRTVFAIDEFQLLHEADKSALTLLQAAWDEFFVKSKAMLILCGSSVGTIERIGLSYASPLYGRRTGHLKLGPLGYDTARLFCPGWSEEDKFRAYAILGGTPAYLEKFSPKLSLEDNVKSQILSRGSFLSQEPLFLLSQETREPLRYASILKAVAGGSTTFGEIADGASIPSTDLSKYLKILIEDLDLVERVYPLLEERRRGRARYAVKDNFFQFWFSYLYPRLDLLELGEAEPLWRSARPALEGRFPRVFERVCIEALRQLGRAGELSYSRIGRWWWGEVEIDAVAVDESKGIAVFVEAKYERKKVGKEVLRRLVRKAEEFPWRRGRRKEEFVIFSKAGFSFEPEEGVRLYSLDDFPRLFRGQAVPQAISPEASAPRP